MKHTLLSFTFVGILTIGLYHADLRQQSSRRPPQPMVKTQTNEQQAAASRELERIFNEDQSDSRPYSTPEQKQATDARARQRIDRVSEIVRQGLVQSADDYYHAAMVFQHGTTAEDALTAHVLATVAGFKGHQMGRWLSAAALDRFLLTVGRSQVLGTNYGRDNFPRYDKYLSDVVRREYCLPPLEVQVKNEEFIEKRVGQFQRWAKECER
jgi:hypothetical protein